MFIYFSTKYSRAETKSEMELKFISPASWNTLSESERTKFWTVGENDVVSRYSEDFPEGMSLDEMKNGNEFYYINSVIPCRSHGEIKLIEITGRGRSVESD